MPTAAADGCAHPFPCEGDWPDGLQGPFTLEEVRHLTIPMSDGITLEAWVGLPDLPAGVSAPIVLGMGPYFHTCAPSGPACYDGPEDPRYWEDPDSVGPVIGLDEGTYWVGMPPIRYVQRGFATAFVSIRGMGGSGGCFTDMTAQQQQDAAEVVAWLGAQEWSNGRIGMIGLSYYAVPAMQAMATGAEELKTSVVTGMSTDQYTYFSTPQGAMNNLHPPLYSLLYSEFSLHPDYFHPERAPGHAQALPGRLCPQFFTDAAALSTAPHLDDRSVYDWRERNLLPHLDDATASILILHGFQDWNTANQEDLAWEALSGAPKRAVEGQWGHEWPTEAYFAAETSVLDVTEPETPGDAPGTPPWWDYSYDELILDWFDYWLKGVGDADGLGTVDYQDDSGRWRRTTAWPPSEAIEQALFLTGETLASTGQAGARAYSTRDNPLDYSRVGEGVTQYGLAAGDLTPESGTWAALCPDHPTAAGGGTGLVYWTQSLDEAVTVAGNPVAVLDISSDQPHGIVDLRLLDVGPDFACDEMGQPTDVRLLTYATADLRFHAGNLNAEPFPVGEPTTVRFDFFNLATRLEAGHRLALVAGLGEGSLKYRSSGVGYPTIEIASGPTPDSSRLIMPVVEGTFGASQDAAHRPPRPFGPDQGGLP